MATRGQRKTPTKLADMVVSQTDLAEAMGVSTRWIRQLVAEGVITQVSRGKFRLGDVLPADRAFLKEGTEKKTGTTSMDKLREEKIADIRESRALRDRRAIDLDEALGVFDEQTGLYVSSLNGLPARITSIPRERRRLDDIFDEERLRLCDLLAKTRSRLETGIEDPDASAEDDAA